EKMSRFIPLAPRSPEPTFSAVSKGRGGDRHAAFLHLSPGGRGRPQSGRVRGRRFNPPRGADKNASPLAGEVPAQPAVGGKTQVHAEPSSGTSGTDTQNPTVPTCWLLMMITPAGIFEFAGRLES